MEKVRQFDWLCMLDKKYYQYLPLFFGIVNAISVFAMFPQPNSVLRLTQTEILSSVTFQAITNFPFQCSLLISIGILIPFINNFIVALCSSSANRRLDLYLLLFLVSVLQSFNIYFVYESRHDNTSYFWNYHLGCNVEVVTLCSVLYSLQMYASKHSSELTTVLCTSSIFYNISLIFKFIGVMQNLPVVVYLYFIFSSIAVICNAVAAYLWFQKFSYSKRSGLQTYHQEFYSFCESLVLTVYLILSTMFFVINGYNFTDLDNKYVTAENLLTILAFYAIVELYFLKLKHIADSSVVRFFRLYYFISF